MNDGEKLNRHVFFVLDAIKQALTSNEAAAIMATTSKLSNEWPLLEEKSETIQI